ncbi:hypothetical protein KR215_012129 [Drosophila sulfurigaster]|nr:hypothetical protein KR215_012129 [Drosophila sulfurigaster]
MEYFDYSVCLSVSVVFLLLVLSYKFFEQKKKKKAEEAEAEECIKKLKEVGMEPRYWKMWDDNKTTARIFIPFKRYIVDVTKGAGLILEKDQLIGVKPEDYSKPRPFPKMYERIGEVIEGE